MHKEHHYKLTVTWTGNNGSGTIDARVYERSHTVQAPGKETLHCSSDSAFRGDVTKYNPEEFFLSALSSCHMLWYLHLCADAGIVVMAYEDNPEGTMVEASAEGRGRFVHVVLRPVITITDISREAEAAQLHDKANEMCFIANSCNFPIHHEPVFRRDAN